MEPVPFQHLHYARGGAKATEASPTVHDALAVQIAHRMGTEYRIPNDLFKGMLMDCLWKAMKNTKSASTYRADANPSCYTMGQFRS